MKSYGKGFLFMIAFLAVAANAAKNNVENAVAITIDKSLYKVLDLDEAALKRIASHPLPTKRNLSAVSEISDGVTTSSMTEAPLWETQLPRGSLPRITPVEKHLLIAYLERPDDVRLAAILALYHLNESLLRPGHKDGDAISHSIIAQYFLNRAQDLGNHDLWVRIALEKNHLKLSRIANRSVTVDVSENHQAHSYFIDAFNYNEQNRYVAVDKLLDDYAQHPNNALTNAYLTASNIWVGGEAGYEDPTVLYSFVLSSYFSVNTVYLAKKLENAWQADPINNQRFRLAPILGGWTVPARRWLARFHGDDAAVALLDEEHRQWLAKNRAFHSASVGLMMFEEPENFLEGIMAWNAGFEHCQEIPTLRSCIDHPRFSYNNLGFLLGGVDYFIKVGQLDMAQMFLSLKYLPQFSYEGWFLGQEAWEHRESNMMERFELYQNDNPEDDPVHFLLKTRKWGPSTITCQACHQVQGRQWSPEEIDNIILPDESVATIGNWPEISTSWYGATK